MKNDIMALSYMSRVTRFLSKVGYRVALVVVPLLALGFTQLSVAQTTIQVTTTQQGVTDPTHCSLQEAIYGAEFDSSTAIDATDPDDFYKTGCVLQGSGAPFTIVLQQKAVYNFDKSWDRDAYNPFGHTATPIIFADITIEGNGATLKWTNPSPFNTSRLFAVGTASIFDSLDNKTVSGTGALTLRNVYIKGFTIKGGDGVCGGGGGLGAGGAIYVGKIAADVPALTVENSTFDSNFATGGNGGSLNDGSSCDLRSPDGGGGGGGLSGNGGTSDGGGGGGGGSRGDGGSGFGSGGGGGGTVLDGADSAGLDAAPGGYLCGASSVNDDDGHSATCPGGGGAGGAFVGSLGLGPGANGGVGAYGGGGGGAGSGDGSLGSGTGGNGGFGGGGGASGSHTSLVSGTNGGNGGFGGGGGYGAGDDLDSNGDPGSGGAFGGRGNGSCCGGGGGALGGAIFNDSGIVVVRNSTFTGNDVDRGEGGINGTDKADRGSDAGAAIFSRNGSLTVESSTISGNLVTGTTPTAGGGIVVMDDGSGASLNLFNTILSRNGSNDCLLIGSVGTKASGNLVLNNNNCPGVAVTTDPQLAPLAVDPRSITGTPTLALPSDSSAVDAGDDSHILATDQRGVARPQGNHTDIGAFEAAPPSADLTLSTQTSPSQVVAGDSFTYTIQLTNAGPNDAQNVAFSDPAPTGVTFSSCSSSVGTCTVSGGVASLNLSTLSNGASATITIQASLGTNLPDGTNVTNTPSVTSSTLDSNPGNNSGSSTGGSITVQNKSDLFVTESANLTSVKSGGTLVYTVNVKNLGPFRAAAVTLVDPVPSGATFVSMVSGGAACTTPAVGQAGTITCNFGNMASGASAIVTFTVQISGSSNKTSITNTAVVSSPNFDPNTANNTASLTTQIFGNKK